ncbi:MAG: hypothetical protein ACLGI9_24285, partial [Thermoanaerobaculia bacterium]
MRFMMLMIPKGYETAEPGTVPEAEAVAAMMKYNEALHKAGSTSGGSAMGTPRSTSVLQPQRPGRSPS